MSVLTPKNIDDPAVPDWVRGVCRFARIIPQFELRSGDDGSFIVGAGGKTVVISYLPSGQIRIGGVDDQMDSFQLLVLLETASNLLYDIVVPCYLAVGFIWIVPNNPALAPDLVRVVAPQLEGIGVTCHWDSNNAYLSKGAKLTILAPHCSNTLDVRFANSLISNIPVVDALKLLYQAYIGD